MRPDTHRIPADKWPAAINTRLPRTIRVIHAEYTDPGFHARFSATGKTYRYCISSEPILNPFDAGLVWHRPLAWSLDALEEAAGLFLGEHDFTAFAALRGNEPRPIPEDYFRAHHYPCGREAGREPHLHDIHGHGFLYKMVRLMAARPMRRHGGKSRWRN